MKITRNLLFISQGISAQRQRRDVSIFK